MDVDLIVDKKKINDDYTGRQKCVWINFKLF